MCVAGEFSMPSTGFDLKVISSAHSSLGLNVAGLFNLQMFSPAFPVKWGWRPHSTVVGAMVLSGFSIGIILTFWNNLESISSASIF